MSPRAKSPAANPTVTPDPGQDGATIRKAFLLEASANLFTIPLITNTHFTLSFLLNNPAHINPASILLARLFGGIVVGGLTSALLAGSTNTRNGIESRRPTYVMLGVGEALLIPMLVLELLKDGGSDAAISKKVATASIACLVPPLLWRLYVLCVRPDILGRYTDETGIGGAQSETRSYGTIRARED
ncbi:hypothetical protein T440DRAFT_513075 [Plenodomus tracheiphilus IPT5]|uniref:Uncharacterized protein n=1 Tax=Plenodomus tracheiphilus IPT5 TaxID=1408161 RepID=A0A6A7BN80_9PLEO|nr:hypothetical protein T440DRAFT_513075 [Plenodomus tracheiphilus IPT5]